MIFIFLIISASLVSGFDFGVTIDNQTGFSMEEEISVLQKDTAALWVDSAIGDKLGITFQGSYTFDIERYFLMDVDALNFSGNFPVYKATPFSIGFSLGRIPFRDFTDLVIAHRADGVELKFSLPFLAASLSAGYTGLLSKPRSSIIMSKTDLKNISGETLFFASPRLVEKLDVRFLEVFLRQDLFFSVIAQQDLRPASAFIKEGSAVFSNTLGGRLNTYYFGLGFSGPIYAGFYMKGYGYLETGKTLSFIDGAYSYTPIVSFLTGGELNYYNRRWLNTNLGIRFVYSSGDADSASFFEGSTENKAVMFTPVSRPDIAEAFSPQLGNIFFAEIRGSLKPLSMLPVFITQNLQLEAKGISLFRSTTGPISETGIDPASESKYLGTEIDGILNFRITSDMGLSIQFGSFFPYAGTFLSTAPLIVGKANFAVSF